MSWYVYLFFIGGPADGKLVSGDQLFKINNVAVDDLSTEQAADIIRYMACKSVLCETTKSATVYMGCQRSSFIKYFQSFSCAQYVFKMCILGANGTSGDSNYL